MNADQTNGKAVSVAPPLDSEKTNGSQKEITDEHVRALMAGKVQARSETSKYLVERAREVLENGRQVTERLQYARNMITELEQEAMRLAGKAESYVQDIKHWEARVTPESIAPPEEFQEEPQTDS
jgi:predicted esterase YcpF (UPF0227 family)